MATALEMKPEQWRRFKPSKSVAARRAQGEFLEVRRKKAFDIAKQAASILRQEFGAERVVVFGSVVNSENFTFWSDIDLAAWGIAPDDFYAAVAAVTGLSPEFKIDLLEPDTCREPIKDAIQKQGVEI